MELFKKRIIETSNTHPEKEETSIRIIDYDSKPFSNKECSNLIFDRVILPLVREKVFLLDRLPSAEDLFIAICQYKEKHNLGRNQISLNMLLKVAEEKICKLEASNSGRSEKLTLCKYSLDLLDRIMWLDKRVFTSEVEKLYKTLKR